MRNKHEGVRAMYSKTLGPGRSELEAKNGGTLHCGIMGLLDDTRNCGHWMHVGGNTAG